jgi:predicted MarR family transcription regulator
VKEPLDERALAIVDERLEQRDRGLREAGALVDSAKRYKGAVVSESAIIQNVTSFER